MCLWSLQASHIPCVKSDVYFCVVHIVTQDFSKPVSVCSVSLIVTSLRRWAFLFSQKSQPAETYLSALRCLFLIYFHPPSTTWGRLLHLQPEDAPCRGQKCLPSVTKMYFPHENSSLAVTEKFEWGVCKRRISKSNYGNGLRFLTILSYCITLFHLKTLRTPRLDGKLFKKTTYSFRER